MSLEFPVEAQFLWTNACDCQRNLRAGSPETLLWSLPTGWPNVDNSYQRVTMVGYFAFDQQALENVISHAAPLYPVCKCVI